MLYLKFYYRDDTQTRFINSPALLNNKGAYEDAFYVYAEDGKFEKHKIVGFVDEVFVESEINIEELTDESQFRKQD
jgi:hypothetical protein